MNSYDRDSPCRFCVAPKRCQNCHTNCPEGLAWDKKYAVEKAKLDKQKAIVLDVVGAKRYATNRIIRSLSLR